MTFCYASFTPSHFHLIVQRKIPQMHCTLTSHLWNQMGALKMQDLKMTDQLARRENASHENAQPEIAGAEKVGPDNVTQKWSAVVFMPCDLVRHFQVPHFQSTQSDYYLTFVNLYSKLVTDHFITRVLFTVLVCNCTALATK